MKIKISKKIIKKCIELDPQWKKAREQITSSAFSVYKCEKWEIN